MTTREEILRELQRGANKSEIQRWFGLSDHEAFCYYVEAEELGLI